MKLVLASASPRRSALLRGLWSTFEVRPAELDELLRPGEAAEVYVERLAREKAAGFRPGEVTLAADTSVVLDGVVLGKPGRDAALGADMLRRLAGRTHQVMTGVAVASERGVTSRVVTSRVSFRALTGEEVDAYVATGEGADKAGGYALQGLAGRFVTRVEGSHTNVVGLPLEETCLLLRQAGVDANLLGARAGEVEQRLSDACTRSGRQRSEVRLVAVSKLHPPERIREAWAMGLRDFGENYAQELRDKHAALGELPGLVWHAIGPLQPRNAKYVAKAAAYFHAVDRLDTAQELSRRRQGAPLRCLIEVNVAGEAAKAGVTPDALPALCSALRALPGLELVGLTTMPPFTDEPEDSRAHFRALAALARAQKLPELSMGTTGDFEVAVEEGATLVRVGTALFGERVTSPGA